MTFTYPAKHNTQALLPGTVYLDGYLKFSSVEADGYVDVANSYLPNLTVVGNGSGVYTATFTSTFPRVINVRASAVLPTVDDMMAVPYDVSTTGFKIRWAKCSTGAAEHPASTDFAVAFQVALQNTVAVPVL